MRWRIALVVMMLAWGARAGAQTLAFDRPEAWAQQYFTTVSMMTGLGPAAPERPGEVSVQMESGWIPALSSSEQRVGFSGTAVEDLNKAPVFFRPRVRVALPARFAVIVGGVPPVRAFGVTPRLLAAAVEWTMIDNGPWRASWRVHGQTGSVTGAFTCPDGVVGAPDGSASNPTGCDARSADSATLRYGAIEFEVARTVRRFGGMTPHASIAVNGIDSRFQVHALTFGQTDNTLLTTKGVTEAFAGGVAVPLGPRFEASIDAFYSPLLVRRDLTAGRSVDGLFNVRGLISYRIRR